MARRGKRQAPEFGGYDEISLAPDEAFPGPLPRRVRLCDEPRHAIVDLECMDLPSAGTPARMRISDAGRGLVPATAGVLSATVLDALDGRRKASTVHRWLSTFKQFLKRIRAETARDICSINLSMFLWGTRDWGASQTKLLRSFFKFWAERKYPCLSSDLKTYIRTSRPPKPRSTTAIQADTPSERPFTIPRVRDLLTRVEDLFITGQFDPQENLLWHLIVTEALRPSQLRLLQAQDVREICSHGWSGIELRVPMVKQHATPSRAILIPVSVTESLATALRSHLGYMRSIVGVELDPTQPLFSVSKVGPSLKESPMNIANLIHRSRGSIANGTADLEDTDLFCRRFKHTKLTHLAILGAPVEVLARAAFHSSTGSLRYYVNFTEERFEDYEKLMKEQHDHIDYVFRGEVVVRGKQSVKSSENLILDESMQESVGSCSGTPCGVLAPIGCYACPRFQAFLDGPHDVVLESLLVARRRAEDMGLPVETVAREDHIISAVEQVLRHIAKIKKKV